MAVITDLNQFLTFNLADEVYAINVARVREVLELTGITKIPRTSEYMRGVINLRGNVVPVVDLRLKFGMSESEQTIDTCIVVMEIELDHETVVVGALADSVKEVIEIEADQIEPPPKIGASLDAKFLKGIGKKDEEFIIILDINKLFTEADLAQVMELGQQQATKQPSQKEAVAAGKNT